MAELQPEDMKDIQGFVMSGYAHLPCVSYMLLRVTMRRRRVAGSGISLTRSRPAKASRKSRALNVALTHHGLKQSWA